MPVDHLYAARRERPRLKSKPLPPRWGTGYQHYTHKCWTVDENGSVVWMTSPTLDAARDLVELLEWIERGE